MNNFAVPFFRTKMTKSSSRVTFDRKLINVYDKENIISVVHSSHTQTLFMLHCIVLNPLVYEKILQGYLFTFHILVFKS